MCRACLSWSNNDIAMLQTDNISNKFFSKIFRNTFVICMYWLNEWMCEGFKALCHTRAIWYHKMLPKSGPLCQKGNKASITLGEKEWKERKWEQSLQIQRVSKDRVDACHQTDRSTHPLLNCGFDSIIYPSNFQKTFYLSHLIG